MANRKYVDADETSVMPARGDPVVGLPALRDWAEAPVERARADGVQLTGQDGLRTGLIRQVLQTGLEVEMADHLGYEHSDPSGRGSGNSRNGSYPKTVATEIGEVDLHIPRDRHGTFEPRPCRSTPGGWTGWPAKSSASMRRG